MSLLDEIAELLLKALAMPDPEEEAALSSEVAKSAERPFKPPSARRSSPKQSKSRTAKQKKHRGSQ